MIRFVLIVSTFGFLSLAWYQMSGGADFQPGTQTAGLPSLSFPDDSGATSADAAAPQVARADLSGADLTSVAKVAGASTGSADSDVIAPKLDVTLAAAAGTPKAAVAPEKAVEVAALDTRTDAVVATSSSNAVVQRVVFGGAAQDQPEAADAAMDLRLVTGNVVNVRNGPGTGYSVVNQLRRGEEVKVLTDPGDGWVKLQAVETKRIGWMSARFLDAAD